jgi:PncC family amidohydrolase
LTAISGSSDVFRGGVIAYHNDVKAELLGVDESTIAEHGAVSEQVAVEMAAGVRRTARTNIGLSITGVAGPSGGTAAKPVGTVWIAADIDGVARTALHHMWGDRDEIRQRAAQWTMELLRLRLIDPRP